MKKGELVLNLFLGLSLIYWGCAGFYFGYAESGHSLIRLFITFLNISVGFLIIFRKPALAIGSTHSVIVSLPSLICGGLIFKLAKPLHLWSDYTEITFIIGGCITLVSFLFLGRNFSILPGIRQVVSKGTFSIIRHPAYFGEIIMFSACLFAGQNILSLILFIIFIPGIVFRIKEEEGLLSKSVNYQKYKEEVRWKLLPFIW